MKAAVPLALLAATLAACTTAQPAGSGVTYQTYTYSCCESSVTAQPWHPGERHTINWIVKPGQRTSSAGGTPVVLSMRLTGPFATVAALKDAIGRSKPAAGTLKIDGSPLQIDNHTTEGVVSVIQLPGDLPVGFYNLDLVSDYGGYRTSGATIIVVN